MHYLTIEWPNRFCYLAVQGLGKKPSQTMTGNEQTSLTEIPSEMAKKTKIQILEKLNVVVVLDT